MSRPVLKPLVSSARVIRTGADPLLVGAFCRGTYSRIGGEPGSISSGVLPRDFMNAGRQSLVPIPAWGLKFKNFCL